MSKGSKVAVVVLVVIVIIVAGLAMSGAGRVNTPESSIRSFFSEVNDGDYSAAVNETAVGLTDNATLQDWYATQLMYYFYKETVEVSSVQDVNSSLTASTSAIINEGLKLIMGYTDISYDKWTVLYVNVTETFSSSTTHYISDFYVIMVHSGDRWYFVQTSFSDSIDGWEAGWAGKAIG